MHISLAHATTGPAAEQAADSEESGELERLQGHVMVPVHDTAVFVSHVGECSDRLTHLSEQYRLFYPRELREALTEVSDRLAQALNEFEDLVQTCPRYDATEPIVFSLAQLKGKKGKGKGKDSPADDGKGKGKGPADHGKGKGKDVHTPVVKAKAVAKAKAKSAEVGLHMDEDTQVDSLTLLEMIAESAMSGVSEAGSDAD